MKITFLSKNPDSALANFMFKQLKNIEWLDCATGAFSEIPQLTCDFFVSVLEDMTLQEIIATCSLFRNEKKNTIYLSFWHNKLIMGPTHFPGSTAGADSCFFVLKQDNPAHIPGNKDLFTTTASILEREQLQNNTDVVYAVFTDLLHELKTIFLDAPGQKLNYIDNVSLYDIFQKDSIKHVSKYIYPLFDGNEQPVGTSSLLDYKILLKKYIHSKSHIRSLYFTGNESDKNPEDQYNSIAIVGGGTAGYLTALSLRNAYPNLPVTLIESSKVPVIGVGEATTPNIRNFLFEKLKFSPLDFYEKVKPTWKLGIQFFWGLPGDYHFNYPFGTPDIRSSFLFNGDINQSSLIAVLMNADSSFVVSATDKKGIEAYSSLSDDVQYALQIDNVSFINYLKEKALEAGVIYIDDLIIDTEKMDSSIEIKAIIGESGMKYEYDFFVDCTGFKSLLIEKSVGSEYVSYSSSLFTDMAITGYIPHVDKIKPYTIAESMNQGWCWNIPMRGENHRGYVFSSAYCSADEAADELKLKNPDIINLKTVRFKSGRHREICIGNVFAIGNSFAFVEPLESTGIHMILKEVEVLTQNLPYLKKSPAIKKLINTNMNAHWDYIKDFLSIHYKYNKKFDTKFWKDCRAGADISSVQWLIDMYHEVGLLSYAGESFHNIIKPGIKDEIFGLVGFDTIMLGQGVVPKNFDRAVKNKHIWETNLNTWKSIQQITIPIEKDLSFLAQSFEANKLRS